MDNIFISLMKNNIEKAVDDFNRLSKEVFVNEQGKLMHPGEYGTYRERIFRDLIKKFIPEKYDIGTGFIITSNGSVSTQCDLIIFDKENTPILENENQRFFPIESVVGVVEVKSILTKSEFKDALLKLSSIKQLRNEAKGPYVFKDGNQNLSFDTKKNPRDQIATFLICEKFNFKMEKEINDIFKNIYKNTDKSLFHNMILSLKDGLVCYKDNYSKPMYHSYYTYDANQFNHSFYFPNENCYEFEHILLFLDYFFMLISSISVLFVEITYYIGSKHNLLHVVEN